MSNIIWKCPVPSSGFLRGVSLQFRPRREVVIAFDFEDSDDKIRSVELIFKDVVHYRVTYLDAMQVDMIKEAYDQVVVHVDSQILREIHKSLKDNDRILSIFHFRICFDDGPCFDFIASSFEEKIK